MIFTNASRGMSTQSDGSEFGCSDGYEHVFTRVAFVAERSLNTTWHEAAVSFCPAWKGSVAFGGVGTVHVDWKDVTCTTGLVQRSTLSSPHVYRRGLLESWCAGLPPIVTHNAPLT